SHNEPPRAQRCVIPPSEQASSRSEVILQGKLNLAQLLRAANPAESSRRCGVLRTPARARPAPRRMVRSVEHLHAELERVPLADPEILHRGEVDVPLRWSDQIVAAAVAELPRRRIREGRWNKVEVRRRIGGDLSGPSDAVEAVPIRDDHLPGRIPGPGRDGSPI